MNDQRPSDYPSAASSASGQIPPSPEPASYLLDGDDECDLFIGSIDIFTAPAS